MTNGDCFDLCLKDIKMAVSSEDTGFCSMEDYLEHEIHSPTDNSEDSVEVKVSAISLTNKRKREFAPGRLPKPQETFTGPLKKRMCLKVKAEINEPHPFRPWSPTPKKEIKQEDSPQPEQKFGSYFRPPSPINIYQSEPEALVKNDIRVPLHPEIQSLSTAETERIILKTTEIFPTLQQKKSDRREQRNYKNMTRERRIEANARERTRVHTISAAFDTLRRSIPSYSHNQKLSKLSVLRIACSYIMTLSSMLSEDESESSVSECVDLVTRTIQREGKLRKKKDDND